MALDASEPGIHRHDYPDGEALAIALAAGIGAILTGAISNRGEASLAVSGGSTPKRLFDILSQTEIEWSRVTVTLVDERMVPPENERSNARLVREHLLKDKAQEAHFVAFETGFSAPQDNAAHTEEILGGVPWPLDAAILGMGTDGHTASFFPGGNRLAAAVDPKGRHRVLPMIADGAGEPRLTLTLPALLEARFLALHIEGEAKRDVLDAALADGEVNEMPVRAVLRQGEKPVHVFWAP